MAADQQVCSDPARPSVLSSPHGARSFRAESDTRFRSGLVERQARAELAKVLSGLRPATLRAAEHDDGFAVGALGEIQHWVSRRSGSAANVSTREPRSSRRGVKSGASSKSAICLSPSKGTYIYWGASMKDESDGLGSNDRRRSAKSPSLTADRETRCALLGYSRRR